MTELAKKILKITVIAIILVIVSFIAFFNWITAPGDTKEILAVASQFKSDTSWHLKYDQLEPPRKACLGDIACPSISRTWETGKVVNYDELNMILNQSGWKNVQIEKDCLERTKDFNKPICPASGKVGNYSVQIFISESTSNEHSALLSLFIK